jgi:hypothetical protein
MPLRLPAFLVSGYIADVKDGGVRVFAGAPRHGRRGGISYCLLSIVSGKPSPIESAGILTFFPFWFICKRASISVIAASVNVSVSGSDVMVMEWFASLVVTPVP